MLTVSPIASISSTSVNGYHENSFQTIMANSSLLLLHVKPGSNSGCDRKNKGWRCGGPERHEKKYKMAFQQSETVHVDICVSSKRCSGAWGFVNVKCLNTVMLRLSCNLVLHSLVIFDIVLY